MRRSFENRLRVAVLCALAPLLVAAAPVIRFTQPGANASRTHMPQRIELEFDAAADAGIEVHGTFMIGLPGETRQTVRQTIDLACSLPQDSVQFSIATPFPGTEFFDECEKNFMENPSMTARIPLFLAACHLLRFHKTIDDVGSIIDRATAVPKAHRPRRLTAPPSMTRSLSPWESSARHVVVSPVQIVPTPKVGLPW